MKISKSPMVNASFGELEEFVRHFSHHGTPVIIGGWAVWFYNPYLGSIDIDVVGPSFRGEFFRIVEEYEHMHGYDFVPAGIGEAVAHKPIKIKGKTVGSMEIDACTYENVGATRLHEDPSLTLPYALCDEDGHKREAKIGKDCVCYVPTRALLTLFKVKAYRDRSYDVANKGATLGSERLSWLRSKVVKDASDIIALLDPRPRGGLLKDKIDYEELKAIADTKGLTKVVRKTFAEVLESKPAISNYGRVYNEKAIAMAIAKLG